MAAPTRVYAMKVRAFVTAERLADIRREAMLTGRSTSDVIRAALDAYFTEQRRAS